MIDKIIHFSLHHRLSVILGVISVVLGGFYAINKMDIDVFPDLTAPTVVVMTDCNGMAAEETERLVTFPIETALNGATNVRRVRSASYFGYSYVWVEFDWGMDVFRARQIVSEKMVTLAEALPENITPQLAPQSSVMGEILFVGLQVKDKGQKTTDDCQQMAKEGQKIKVKEQQITDSGDGTSQMELRSIADWVIKPVVLATGGVSQVTIIGGDYKQYQVMADPQRMNACGITMDELAKTVSTMSANAEGGVVRDYGNEYALRGMGRTNDIEELSATLIKDGIRVSDVAKIHIGPAVKMGTGSMNGRPAVILSISKQPNINTLYVTRKIEKNLEDIKSALPDDVVLDTHIFRQADFIESSVNNVGRALVEGAILCIIILFLFLGSMRTTVISVAAIPLSLLGTIVVLWLMDMDINTMTLGGMCIAIGSLVDDAIIDVENVYKRLSGRVRCDEGLKGEDVGLRMNDELKEDAVLSMKEKIAIIFEASKEIRSSILNATAIVIVAFIPMFFLSGMEGRMLKPLGITYIVALAMSLIVAMTVTPLFCRFLLTDDKYLQQQQKERRFVTRMHDDYKHSLVWVLEHGKMVLGATVLLFVSAIIVMFTFGSSFLPDFNEGALTITAVCPPGVSLDETDKVGQILEKRILEVPEVASTSRRTGRGELDEHSQATNSMEIDVSFKKSNRSNEEITREIREKMATVPGIASIVGQPLGHRIDHMISGTRASIAIKLFGNDLSEMYSTAQNIKGAISHIEGLVDVNIDQQVMTPQLHIKPNREAMARYGITMDDFNSMISYGFSGEKIGEIYEGQRAYDLVLRYSPEFSGSIEGVRNCPLLAPLTSHSDNADEGKAGGISGSDRWGATLSDISAVVSTFGPNSISRENVQRKLVIAANVSGRDVGSVVNDIRKTIDSEVRLPEGYRLEYGGQFESAQKATRILIIATFIALIVIYLLLYAEFKSFSLSAIVMAGLPLALIGGVLGIALSSWVLSIPSIIGFITLFGIATRNSILLVEKYQLGDVVEGSLDRLNPILMTALTSALALIPLIINGDKAGNEIQSPMAIVVLGGLITSTLLNLYVMPIIYELYSKKARG